MTLKLNFKKTSKKINKQISNCQEEIQSKNKIITSIEPELSDTKSKLEDEIKKSNILIAELSNLKQNSNISQTNIEIISLQPELVEKCKRQENIIEMLKIRLTLLQNDFEKSQKSDSFNQLEIKNQELKNKIDEILQENGTLVETIKELKRKNEFAHQYEEDYDELNSRYESILDEFEQLQKENIELKVQVKDLNQEISTKSTMILSLVLYQVKNE